MFQWDSTVPTDVITYITPWSLTEAVTTAVDKYEKSFCCVTDVLNQYHVDASSMYIHLPPQFQ